MDNPAGNYFNMHTPLNPGGAIRGPARSGAVAAAVQSAVQSVLSASAFIQHSAFDIQHYLIFP